MKHLAAAILALIVNTAYGDQVDQKPLSLVIKEASIAGAAVDFEVGEKTHKIRFVDWEAHRESLEVEPVILSVEKIIQKVGGGIRNSDAPQVDAKDAVKFYVDSEKLARERGFELKLAIRISKKTDDALLKNLLELLSTQKVAKVLVQYHENIGPAPKELLIHKPISPNKWVKPAQQDAAEEGVLPPYKNVEAEEKNEPISLEAKYRVVDKRVVKVTIKNVSGKPLVLRLLKAKHGKDKIPADYKYTTADYKWHSYTAPHISFPASPYPTFGYNFIYLFNNDTYEYVLFASEMDIASIDSIALSAPFFDPQTTERKDLPENFQKQSWEMKNEIHPSR